MPPLLNPREWLARNRLFIQGALAGFAAACAGIVAWLIWFLARD